MLTASFLSASDVCQAESIESMCSPETKTENTGAIIGGVVAVAVVALIAAVTLIVIVILVLRSRSANFTTPKTRLVYMPSKTLSLNKVW